jgi:NTE family protein
LFVILAFSGGGTRAAALSYGVLAQLQQVKFMSMNGERTLLDEVDVISSVSGGSFTSAYYGLYGDRIFVDYEERFLRSDVEGALLRGLLNPLRWFSSHGRTEMAVSYYQQSLFGDATFADLARRDAPLILINSSDLSTGGDSRLSRSTSTCCARTWAVSRWRAPSRHRAPCRCCSSPWWWRTTAAAPAACRRG